MKFATQGSEVGPGNFQLIRLDGGAGVDLLVVVVGIPLALQLSGWVQERQDRLSERGYLVRLRDDMEIERARMDAALRYANQRIEAVRLLERLVADPALATEEPARVPWAVETASWRSFPQIGAFVYGELQSTCSARRGCGATVRTGAAPDAWYLIIDRPVFDFIRDEPRFQAVVARRDEAAEPEARRR